MARRSPPLTAILRALLAVAALTAAAAEDVVTVKSPDGRIVLELFDGPPPTYESEYQHKMYSVTFDGKPLIDPSYLGFLVDSQILMGHKLGLTHLSSRSVDETYALPVGKTRTVRDHYNEVVAEYIQNGSQGRRMTMQVRAFNDGVAFRYIIPPSPPMMEPPILDEITQFHFARDAQAYAMTVANFQSGYEDEYHTATLSGIHNGSLVALPFLVEQPGVAWVAVTEAALDNYPGAYLAHVEGSTMRTRLAPRVDGSGLTVKGKAPLTTPWRVLLIARRPEQLIESNIVTSLNDPSEVPDTRWIQPGKAAWSWWSGTTPMTTAGIEALIDFAAQAGLEYVLIDEGWAAPGGGGFGDLVHPAKAIDMPRILERARQKKVGVWLWTHWRSVESQAKEAFALFQKWGVRGVVVDSMDRDDQEMVKFYRLVAEQAAEHRLMVDFHGAYKPDGLSRTYPNILTREAVLGLEYLKSTARPTPQHNVMLAFTRMLAGPLDYTPGGFNNVTREEFEPREEQPMVLGTRAHQLALLVVFESPLQVLADAPEAYRGQRDFDFIKAVPATWDETRGVMGEVGEYIAVARRNSETWYLGAITNWTARELDVPLAFLGPGEWIAEVYADADDAGLNPKHTAITEQHVTTRSALHLKLASGGGAAIRFRPAR